MVSDESMEMVSVRAADCEEDLMVSTLLVLPVDCTRKPLVPSNWPVKLTVLATVESVTVPENVFAPLNVWFAARKGSAE